MTSLRSICLNFSILLRYAYLKTSHQTQHILATACLRTPPTDTPLGIKAGLVVVKIRPPTYQRTDAGPVAIISRHRQSPLESETARRVLDIIRKELIPTVQPADAPIRFCEACRILIDGGKLSKMQLKQGISNQRLYLQTTLRRMEGEEDGWEQVRSRYQSQ